MTSLLDIGPLTEEHSVNGKLVTVQGLTPEGFFLILEKFPMLGSMFSSSKNREKVNMVSLQTVAPGSVALALSIATTDRNKFEYAAWRDAVDEGARVAIKLSAHHQLVLFNSAFKLTFPDGIGPFMRGVEDLASSINRATSGTLPTAMGQDTTSSRQSRSGFVTDSPGIRLGRAARSASSTRSAKSGSGSTSASEPRH